MMMVMRVVEPNLHLRRYTSAASAKLSNTWRALCRHRPWQMRFGF